MTLDEIERRNPEWRPWLGAIGTVLAHDGGGWDAAVPQRLAAQNERAPLLAGATLELRALALGELLSTLAGAAGAGARDVAEDDARRVFRSALNRDAGELERFALGARLDPAAFGALAALLPLPFLQACGRGLRAMLPKAWTQGYCPLCGAWAAFAEICGVERARYLRCGDCGTAWQAHGLSCPYCGQADHEALGVLVAEREGMKAAVEVCRRCRGYLKAFSRLSLSAPQEALLEALASVELDLAALERGYRRADGPGYPLAVRLA